MAYSSSVQRLLDKAGVSPGSPVALSLKDGSSVDGLLMPRIQIGSADVLVVKLHSGYNVGIGLHRIRTVSAGEGQKSALGKARGRSPTRADAPPISLIATGGTIAARVDYRLGGVSPIALDPYELISVVPELEGTVNLKNSFPILEAEEPLPAAAVEE